MAFLKRKVDEDQGLSLKAGAVLMYGTHKKYIEKISKTS